MGRSLFKRRDLWFAWVTAAMMSAVVVAQAPKPTPAPSSKSSAVPRLVIRNGVMTWTNAKAFQPVPASLVEQGATVCRIFNTPARQYRAAGYHSQALNVQGKPFPGGGYYCIPTK